VTGNVWIILNVISVLFPSPNGPIKKTRSLYHNHSLNPTLAEVKKLPFDVNTTVELQIIKKNLLPTIPARLVVGTYPAR
jgi:hypothetical protein